MTIGVLILHKFLEIFLSQIKTSLIGVRTAYSCSYAFHAT